MKQMVVYKWNVVVWWPFHIHKCLFQFIYKSNIAQSSLIQVVCVEWRNKLYLLNCTALTRQNATDENIIVHQLKPVKQNIYPKIEQLDGMNHIYDDNNAFSIKCRVCKDRIETKNAHQIQMFVLVDLIRVRSLKIHCQHHTWRSYHLTAHFLKKFAV